MNSIKLGCQDPDCPRCTHFPDPVELPIRKAVTLHRDTKHIEYDGLRNMLVLLQDWARHVGLPPYFQVEYQSSPTWDEDGKLIGFSHTMCLFWDGKTEGPVVKTPFQVKGVFKEDKVI